MEIESKIGRRIADASTVKEASDRLTCKAKQSVRMILAVNHEKEQKTFVNDQNITQLQLLLLPSNPTKK